MKNLQPTVVVVHCRTRDLTNRLLNSLSCDPKLSKIVLVDNDEQRNEWPAGLRVIRTGYNYGHGPGLHHGIMAADSDWVLCLDSDTRIEKPGLIEYLLSLIDGLDSIYGVGRIVAVDERGLNVRNQPRLWQTREGVIDSADRNAIAYLHPYCALLNRSAYLNHQPFRDLGAPCLSAMKSITDYRLVQANRLSEFVYHEGRGTRSVTTSSFRVRHKPHPNTLEFSDIAPKAPVEAYNHALAILTYVPDEASQRLRERLPEAICSLESSGYTGPVLIVDDGSNDKAHLEYLSELSKRYRIIQRNNNGGISRAKNTCIRALMEHGVDVGFIAEDDIRFHNGWSEAYLKAHKMSGIHHFSWAWDRPRMRKSRKKINGFDVVSTSGLNGVFLTFTPEVIRQVGGFRILPGKWGYTHVNWTRRIIRKRLSPFQADIVNSNRFLTVNSFADVSTVSDERKRALMSKNRRPANDMRKVYAPLTE